MNRNFRSSINLTGILRKVRFQRGLAWGIIILFALLAFEVFNYSTTEFALKDVLGDLGFLGLQWSTILAVAFCGIDFAGIARLFTPEQGKDEPAEVWYLFGAWLLAASMNAMLTWWGVSVAIVQNGAIAGSAVVSSSTMTNIVPVFVAMMVWLIRVLIIGTFSVGGERLFSQGSEKAHFRPASVNPSGIRSNQPAVQNRMVHNGTSANLRSAQKPVRAETGFNRPEPSYHNLSMNTSSGRDGNYSDPI